MTEDEIALMMRTATTQDEIDAAEDAAHDWLETNEPGPVFFGGARVLAKVILALGAEDD